jgi:5-methylcytosine-specific restriction endonuclease McrA
MSGVFVIRNATPSFRESYRKHYAKNYPRYLANARNWRARKKLADGVHTSEEIDQMVRDQQDVCAYCESALNGNYHVDHMIPLSRGGRNDRSNLAVTYGSCNRSKGTIWRELRVTGILGSSQEEWYRG